MAERRKLKEDDPEQSRRFVETAEELGSDEIGEAFTDALDTIVSQSKPIQVERQPEE